MLEVKAAAVQAAPVLFDTLATLEKVEALAAGAAKNDANFIVFPEAFIGGYPKGSHFGAPVGSRSAEGRSLFRQYFEGAIEVPGPETERLARLAGALQTDLVVGAIERAPKSEGGGTLYCSALVFSADGKFCGRRRKLMLKLVVTARSTRPMRLRTTPYMAKSATAIITAPETVPPGRTNSSR